MKPRMSTKFGDIFFCVCFSLNLKKAGKRDQKDPITTQDNTSPAKDKQFPEILAKRAA